MKKYYIVGGIIAVVLFVVMLAITSISMTAIANAKIGDTKQYGQESIVIRFYMDDDLDNAAIKYLRISPKEKIKSVDSKYIPTKAGYDFCGFYDSKDYQQGGNVVITADGYFVMVPTVDTYLYPLFTEKVQ